MYTDLSQNRGITMTALFYFLLKHRDVYTKLRDEVDTHLPRDPNEDIRFSDARALPYLQAVVNETFRMHPSFAVMYERVVPAGGAIIAGSFVPAGTIVGVNPWVVQRNPEVFGPDVDVYRPERWLDKDAARVKAMHQSMHQFGAGEYICLGRHVSMLEIYMVVPTMLRRFEVCSCFHCLSFDPRLMLVFPSRSSWRSQTRTGRLILGPT